MGLTGLIWRGDVYDVNLGQAIGHDPGFTRLAVVVSMDIINNGPGELVSVVPISSKFYGLRSQVELDPGTSGLDHVSYARCDQIRTISTRRLSIRLGEAAQDEVNKISQALRFILDL
jgi:mRNA interferase MazF